MNTFLPMHRCLDTAFFAPSRLYGLPTERTLNHTPRADILEGEKEFQVRLDMPGVRIDDLEINLENQMLTVKAEREFSTPEGYDALHREIPAKVNYERSFNISKTVDVDGISAKFENGILEITLPRSAKSMPRQIEVH